MLEAAEHVDNTFVTLTYSDAALPRDQSVCPRTVSNFIKRLRKNTGLKIRYFACGEYGDLTFRPHYHIALFGYPNCRRGVTSHFRDGRSCCYVCQEVQDAWRIKKWKPIGGAKAHGPYMDMSLGHVHLGFLEKKSAAYIAAYTTKKMTSAEDERLEGRHPEFARMSRRPGLGVGMLWDVASALMEHNLHEKMVDVPLTLSHGTEKLPLGRFMRRKLRTLIGRDEKAPEVLTAQSIEMQALREIAKTYTTARVPGLLEVNYRNEILKKSEGKRIQIEGRFNRQKQGKGHL